MEKIFLVKNSDFSTIDYYLNQGWKIKLLQPVAESIAPRYIDPVGLKEHYTGNIYAYVVLEKE